MMVEHCPVAEWRNWQTHQTQNLASFTRRVGSTPTSATTFTRFPAQNSSSGQARACPPTLSRYFGSITASTTWITPLEAATSAFVTCALSTITPLV